MSDRWSKIVDAFARHSADCTPGVALCATAVDSVGVWGSAIALVASDGSWGPLGASGDGAAALEEMQFTLGAGPLVDLGDGRHPVTAPDMEHEPHPRWAGFAEAALEAGVRSVHCFPIRVGAARIGAFTFYDVRQGMLSPERYRDALALAGAAARVLLAAQAEVPPGALMAELSNPAAYRAEVHQAAGMVSAQLGIPVADALARVRAHAWVSDRTVTDVAADVIARRLVFEP